MNNVFKYKCVSNLQVKPGYTRKSPGIPEKYPSARPHAAHALLPGSLRQLRRAPPAQVRAPHHVLPLQVPESKEDQHDAGFADTRWVELEELYENCGKAQLNGAVKKYRKAEDEAVKAAIAEFEEGIED